MTLSKLSAASLLFFALAFAGPAIGQDDKASNLRDSDAQSATLRSTAQSSQKASNQPLPGNHATLGLEVTTEELQVSGGTPGSPVWILVGLEQRPFTLPGGTEVRVWPLVILSGFFDRFGEFTYSLEKSERNLEPVTVLVQAVMMIDAKGFRASEMVEVEVGDDTN